MQYKIPVQIENEDPIILGLSLRQLIILMVAGGIWYSLFQSLAAIVAVEVAAIPGIIIFIIGFLIAKFNQYGMTFTKFVLAFARSKANLPNRRWMQWVDSFQPIDIWYVAATTKTENDAIDTKSKMDKIKDLDNKINDL